MTDALPDYSRQVLVESLGISVQDFRCRAHVHAEGPEELNDIHSIVFVRRGLFRRTWQREASLADPNHVLFFNAGEVYRIAHPLPGGDECTILGVSTALALELVARHAPREAQRPETPFRLGQGLSSAVAFRLQYELLGLIRRGVTALALEDALAELVDTAVAAAYARGSLPTGSRGAAARRHRELAEAAKLELGDRLESPPSLAQLGHSLGCSPFHLSRTFREQAGLSLRCYQGRLRARAAGYRLMAGASDLTSLALDLGYADHSHMTNAFRREWGMPPSRLRARLASGSKE